MTRRSAIAQIVGALTLSCSQPISQVMARQWRACDAGPASFPRDEVWQYVVFTVGQVRSVTVSGEEITITLIK